MIVHLGTKVQTIFAQLDAEGNIVKQLPCTAETPRLDGLTDIRTQLEAQWTKLKSAE